MFFCVKFSSMKVVLYAVVASATISVTASATEANDIVVVPPAALPQSAQIAGQSMTLHAFNDGKTYLYIEQQQLGRLLILDVTDPAHIREAGAANLDLPVAFEFSSNLGFSAGLVCFPGRQGYAVMSFETALQPTLSAVNPTLGNSEKGQIAPNVLLASEESSQVCAATTDDLNVVDSATALAPHLLSTVKNVHKTVVRKETGTTFLLGENGLTVIRQPRVELRYRQESSYAS